MNAARIGVALFVLATTTAPFAAADRPLPARRAPAPVATAKAAPAVDAKASPRATVNVEATSLVCDPPQPQPGQLVTLKLALKNAGSAPASVPWAIHDYTANETLGIGATAIEPGATVIVTARWTARAGTQRLQGYVDPSATLRNTAAASAQVTDVSVDVPAPPSASKPASHAAMETRSLEHLKAKHAGAQFVARRDGPPLCSVTTTGGDPNPRITPDEIMISILCGGVPTGARGEFELFEGFTLRNGWRVVRVNVLEDRLSGEAGWQWNAPPPPIGAASPSLKLRGWAAAGAHVIVRLKVTIEGPKGTDPYQ